MSRRDEQRSPRRVAGGSGIAVEICKGDCCYWPPKHIAVFRLPATDGRIGLGEIHQRQETRFFQKGKIVAFGHLDSSSIPETGRVAIPKNRQERLVRRAPRTGRAAHEPGLVDIGRVLRAGQRGRTRSEVRRLRWNKPWRHISKLWTCTRGEGWRSRAPLTDTGAAREGWWRRRKMVRAAPGPDLLGHVMAPIEAALH